MDRRRREAEVITVAAPPGECPCQSPGEPARGPLRGRLVSAVVGACGWPGNGARAQLGRGGRGDRPVGSEVRPVPGGSAGGASRAGQGRDVAVVSARDPDAESVGSLATPRDRDAGGRARQARPRDALGRPLPYGSQGVEAVSEEALPPDETLEAARALVAAGRPFSAHEVLEARWKAGPEGERDLWQGLAQICVALTHAARGNRKVPSGSSSGRRSTSRRIPLPAAPHTALTWMPSPPVRGIASATGPRSTPRSTQGCARGRGPGHGCCVAAGGCGRPSGRADAPARARPSARGPLPTGVDQAGNGAGA